MELTTYDDVNNAWGGITLPPITFKAAAPIFDKLVRKFGGRSMRAPWWRHRTNRSWAAPKGSDTKYVRENGLPTMVHEASHWVFANLHPTFKTHSAAHAKLEREMVEYVLAKGLHQPRAPKVKTTTTADDRRALALAHTEAAIKRWTTKAKRADTALKKLRKKLRRLHAATK